MSGLELHEAASTGDIDSLEEYIKSEKYDINLKDPEWKNKTPLHWAAEKGFVQCMRLLLDHGAKGTSRMDMGWTPAHSAAEAGKLPALRALHDDYKVPIDRKDKYGDTPKRIAEIYGHQECVKYLNEAEQEMKDRAIKVALQGPNQEEWSDEEEDDDDDEELEDDDAAEDEQLNTSKQRDKSSTKIEHKR